tara:strand:- start:34 stop:429 length:396 start_codon:yes stop_codon:yes gene_type:complete
MMSVVAAGLWFLAGALLYKSVSYMIDLGSRALFARTLLLDALRLALVMVEDVSTARALKYSQMKATNLDEKDIELAKAFDEAAMKSWQTAVIRKIIGTFPKQYSGLITFDDWQGAMDTLNKEVKRGETKWT